MTWRIQLFKDRFFSVDTSTQANDAEWKAYASDTEPVISPSYRTIVPRAKDRKAWISYNDCVLANMKNEVAEKCAKEGEVGVETGDIVRNHCRSKNGEYKGVTSEIAYRIVVHVQFRKCSRRVDSFIRTSVEVSVDVLDHWTAPTLRSWTAEAELVT